MKKMLCLILIALMLFTTAALADAASSLEILNEYAGIMAGKWELEDYSKYTSIWKGMPTSFTFNQKYLSVSNAGQVYYQWDNDDYQGNGGEVLRTLDANKIGLVFSSNGITTIAYYVKA